MSKDQKNTCMYCRFWHFYAKPSDEDLWPAQPGECRRRAPITNELHDSLSPPRRGGDWCGEFEFRDDRAARLLTTSYMNRTEGAAK